jgi:hypothetical protein
MIFAIVAAFLAYNKAKASGRKGWVWALAGLAVYIGTQLLIGVAAGMIILVGMFALGWPESMLTAYELPINIIAIAGAFAATWGLLKFLDRVPREEYAGTPPPPPPTFAYEQPVSQPVERSGDLHRDNR